MELKNKFWAIAKSSTLNTYEEAMEDMRLTTERGWKWCKERAATHWSLSHFDPKFKCDILLNNHSESYNKSIISARKKGILGCLEEIRTTTMVRMGNRRLSGGRWKTLVGPRVEKILRKAVRWSNEYRVLASSRAKYEIHGRGAACISGVTTQHTVALDLKTCTCRRWDVSGLPCGHACCAIFSLGKTPDEFVDECYSKEAYMRAYEPVMNPIAGVREWEKMSRPIAPPLYRRQPGRPPVLRTPSQGKIKFTKVAGNYFLTKFN